MQNERKVVELNLSDVLPNRFQPRIKFDENAINELALSIQKYGVIQPIVVRQIGNKYEIIAGERRYKASKVAGKQTIPAIISELNDKDSVEIALIENVQREDLTPIEKAVSYKKILDMGYINQEELAKKVGKSQSAIANTLRLLNLSDDVQEALLENKISERHARSLLKIKNEKQQVEMLNRIINERLTVRKTDEEIDKMQNENNQIINEVPEEIVQIPDTAMSAPGFMDIDAIENSAKDIIQPQKPVANIDMLMKSNVEPTPVPETIPTSKFFNLFDENESSSNAEDDGSQFKLENSFNNMSLHNDFLSNNNENNNVTPTFEIPTNPVEPQPVQPTFEIPTNPIEPQPVQPTFEIPTNPIEPQPVQPTFEIPANPVEPQPVQPTIEMPTNPIEPQPVQPTIEMPTNPIEPQPVQPTFEIPNMSEVTPSFDYNIPISSSTDDVFNADKSMPSMANQNQEISVKNVSTPTNSSVKAAVPNIRVALNTIRECQNTLEKYGFMVDVEEIDFEDSYQVIFKIEK